MRNQNSKGVSFMKNCHLMYLGPCGGSFWSNPWLPTGQIWAAQTIFFDHFKIKIQNNLVHFYAKSIVSFDQNLPTEPWWLSGLVCQSFINQCSKLMRLEVPNRKIVVESKSLSEFDCRLLSDLDSND